MKKKELLLRKLDWNMPLNVQQEGITMAKEIDDLSIFVQPQTEEYNKNVWENCAIIISDRSDNELLPYLNSLFEWIQDMNWPGAVRILERIKKIPGNLLKDPFIHSINLANNMNEDYGQIWIYNLSFLLENKALQNSISKDLILKIRETRRIFESEG